MDYEVVYLNFKKLNNQKSMSNGMRNMEKTPLTDDEIKLVKEHIHRINADEKKFIFNAPNHVEKSTCYNYVEDVVYVTKNVINDSVQRIPVIL